MNFGYRSKRTYSSLQPLVGRLSRSCWISSQWRCACVAIFASKAGGVEIVFLLAEIKKKEKEEEAAAFLKQEAKNKERQKGGNRRNWPMKQQRDLCCLSPAVCLLAILIIGSEGRDIRPSKHGLAHAKDPGPASPAMVAFYHGGSKSAALPVTSNASESPWTLAPPAPVRPSGGGRRSTALLAAALACGVVGLALLVAAVVVYVAHVRRSEPEIRTDSHLSLVRRSG